MDWITDGLICVWMDERMDGVNDTFPIPFSTFKTRKTGTAVIPSGADPALVVQSPFWIKYKICKMITRTRIYKPTTTPSNSNND